MFYLTSRNFRYLDRIGMEDDVEGHSDIERELEIRRIQVKQPISIIFIHFIKGIFT
jgi:hypothetical protein